MKKKQKLNKIIIVLVGFFFAHAIGAAQYKYNLEAIEKKCRQRIELIERKLSADNILQKKQEINAVCEKAIELQKQGKVAEALELYNDCLLQLDKLSQEKGADNAKYNLKLLETKCRSQIQKINKTKEHKNMLKGLLLKARTEYQAGNLENARDLYKEAYIMLDDRVVKKNLLAITDKITKQIEINKRVQALKQDSNEILNKLG